MFSIDVGFQHLGIVLLGEGLKVLEMRNVSLVEGLAKKPLYDFQNGIIVAIDKLFRELEDHYEVEHFVIE